MAGTMGLVGMPLEAVDTVGMCEGPELVWIPEREPETEQSIVIMVAVPSGTGDGAKETEAANFCFDYLPVTGMKDPD